MFASSYSIVEMSKKKVTFLRSNILVAKICRMSLTLKVLIEQANYIFVNNVYIYIHLILNVITTDVNMTLIFRNTYVNLILV